MGCKCIETLNKRLESENVFIPDSEWTRMDTFGDPKPKKKSTVIIQVNKIFRSNKRLKKIVPTFCPFCGKEYKYN